MVTTVLCSQLTVTSAKLKKKNYRRNKQKNSIPKQDTKNVYFQIYPFASHRQIVVDKDK